MSMSSQNRRVLIQTEAALESPRHFIISHHGRTYLVDANDGRTLISARAPRFIRFVSRFLRGPVTDEGDASHPEAQWALQESGFTLPGMQKSRHN